jgi:hypothetical protein
VTSARRKYGDAERCRRVLHPDVIGEQAGEVVAQGGGGGEVDRVEGADGARLKRRGGSADLGRQFEFERRRGDRPDRDVIEGWGAAFRARAAGRASAISVMTLVATTSRRWSSARTASVSVSSTRSFTSADVST